MYNIAREIIKQENTERKTIPLPVINEIYETMNTSAVYRMASEKGDEVASFTSGH